MKRAVSSPLSYPSSTPHTFQFIKEKEKKEEEGIGIPGCAGAKAPAY